MWNGTHVRAGAHPLAKYCCRSEQAINHENVRRVRDNERNKEYTSVSCYVTVDIYIIGILLFRIVNNIIPLSYDRQTIKDMYEQAASSWAVGLYSLLDPTKFLPFLPSLWDKQAIGSRYPNDTKVRETDVLVGYLVLFWVILYLVYEKCLNVSPTHLISSAYLCLRIAITLFIMHSHCSGVCAFRWSSEAE